MKIQKLAAISLVILSSFAATGVAPTKSELEAMYDKAFREFDANRYTGALKALDAIDARQPDLAESLNLRGVILMRQGEYDKAEAALRKALQVEPKFWNASFNLAEIPFLRKNWAEARNRFEALVSGNGDELQNETNLLIQYKILLTFVLQDREKMVDWILNKFETSKDSPALYYSNAAIALQHKNQKEAKEWIDSAQKQFSPQLNKLFAESFYEIGWLQKPAGEGRAAIEVTSTTERAERLKADSRANFEKAERAFQQRDFEGALKLLDLADEGVPNQPASYNLRGEILMEQKKFDEAEVALQKAFSADPKFREAQYNLAQIPFKKKDYATARTRLEALFAETPGDEKNQAAQLIKFKIFITLLLEDKDAAAQKMMDEFKFTGDTPALYYAQAAWAFKHGSTEEGNDWIVSAKKIYSPPLNIVFADSFYDIGWLTRPSEVTPMTTALAQADASPPTGATPSMRFGQADSLPAPVVAGGPPGTAPAGTATTAATGAAPGEAKPSPVANGVAAPIAASSPAPAPAITAPPITVPATTKQAQLKSADSSGKASASPAAKQAVPPSVAANPAATALAPSRARELSQSTFAETMDRGTNPRTLLFVALLLGGTFIIVWLVVQQVRRQLPTVGLYRSSDPLTEPPFDGDGATSGDERKISRSLLAGGPPKLSLHLRASEPLLRKGLLPSGMIVARGTAPESETRANLSPNEIEKSIVEPTPVIASATPPAEEIPAITVARPDEAKAPGIAEALPLRDQEEVSRAAASEFSTAAIAPKASKETPTIAAAPAEPEIAELDEQLAVPELAPEAIEPDWELVSAQEEPIRQGPPISTTALTTETVMPELTQPEPESTPVRNAPETAAAAALAGERAQQSSVETPSFASKVITTKPSTLQSTTPVIMPESTITPAPAVRTPSSTVAVQQPAGGMHTAVQLTFSLEIASMQLTPTFKMSGLQLKPTSKVVTMRLAPSQHPQPPMNLQVTFEVARIDLAGGTISTIRLAPSAQQKPAVISSSSFAISGLELVPGAGSAPVQLTPSHQEQASVHLTAAFQIAAIEFSPLFEIVAIVLNSTSKNVSMQLPGSGPSSIDGAPIFEIEKVELGGNNELGTIQVNPLNPSNRRA